MAREPRRREKTPTVKRPALPSPKKPTKQPKIPLLLNQTVAKTAQGSPGLTLQAELYYYPALFAGSAANPKASKEQKVQNPTGRSSLKP